MTRPESAREIRDRVWSGERSAEETVREALTRIAQRDGPLEAFLARCPDRALTEARSVDRRIAAGERPPLAGVPVAVKDILCTREVPTTCGSRILEGYLPPYDATAVERLARAGAVMVGKTNLDEFAMGSSTEHSAYGPTRNPWDAGRVPGGSSGGSAAAVAAGMVPVALGTDTGGSVRQPAAFCGVVGLKPTYGRISRYGLIAFASSLDQVGAFGRTVRDCAATLGALAGPDGRDMTASGEPVPDYEGQLDDPLPDLRVGVPREYFGDGLTEGVARRVESALETLRGLGASTREVSLPHTRFAIPTYYLVADAEASSNLARYDGVRYGRRAPGHGDLAGMYRGSRTRGFGPEVKRRIMLGTYALSSGYYDAYYGKASRVRQRIRDDFEAAFREVDLIACPTTPETAFPLGERTAEPLAMYLSDVYTVTASLAGIPAISLPCGLDDTGLPVGFQLMARHFDEPLLLRAAHALEAALGFQARPPLPPGLS